MKELVLDLAVSRSIGAFFTGGIVEWSADGKYLFSTCTNVVKVINLDGNLSTFIIGDEEESLRITCICLDKRRMRLVVAYNNQLVREYTLPSADNPTCAIARTWKSSHTAPILVMKFSDDGAVLATGSADHNVKIWDMNQQHCTHTLKGEEVVSSMCFARDNRLLVGYIGGQVNMFDLNKGATQKLLHTWTNHTSHLSSIVLVARGRRAVFFSRDQTASIVDVETREKLKAVPLFEPIESAVLAHNGNLVTVGEEGTVKEWLIENGRSIRSKVVTRTRIDSMTYNPIRDQLLLVSAEENIFIMNFGDLSLERQIVGFQDEIYSCCLFGKDESHVAVASNSNDIRLYETATWDCQLIEGHSENVLCVTAADWDKNLLASCSKDNSIILWRLSQEGGKSTLLPVAKATGHTNSVNAVRFSHSHKNPFLLSVSTDTTLKLWALGDVDLKAKEGNLEEIPKITCSSTIVAHGKDVNCVDVALSDSVCVTGGMDKMAKLWHIDGRKMQLGIAGNLTGHRRGVADVKFSPNSQKVATCSGDMTVKIWNLQDNTCQQTLNGHNCAVFSIIFVNHGTQLISADSAGILKIWTLATGEVEKTIEAHTDKIWSICPRADESEYITAGTDGTITVWKDVTEEKRLEEDNKRRQKIEEEQTLSNLLEQERFQDALEYALGLIRPFCALKVRPISCFSNEYRFLVVNQLIERDQLTEAVAKLEMTKLQTLLDFATQWNTNSRTSQASQMVLYSILNIHAPGTLLKLPNITNCVQAFIPYTKRHMERLNKARQDVALLSFTWDQMRLS